MKRDADYGCWDTCDALVSLEEEFTGRIGAATPAVCEPKPNFSNVRASSFPEGFSLCPAWNFLIASTVESSHFPLGVPANDPSFPSAC